MKYKIKKIQYYDFEIEKSEIKYQVMGYCHKRDLFWLELLLDILFPIIGWMMLTESIIENRFKNLWEYKWRLLKQFNKKKSALMWIENNKNGDNK